MVKGLSTIGKGLSTVGHLWYAAPPHEGEPNETILTADGLPGPGHPEQLRTCAGLTPRERRAWDEITRS
ncbi:DUF6059 family protein [Kitasatospora sp. NPDC001540]|uniref:DUF6059 family protein n=1 Tax=Kitasatospora sp. NPDC001540 TaxID=3364014 RepID=UPI003694173C